MSLWFARDPELLTAIEAEIERDFPGLRVLQISDKIVIKGRLDVFSDSILYDSYGISVELADNHPDDLPKVFETEDRLPKTMNRHFYLEDKSACLFVPLERNKFWSNPRSISQFLGGPVNAFFYSQTFFDKEGRFPFGDRSHGLLGVLESVKDLCGLKTNRQAIAMVGAMYKGNINRQGKCPCGSTFLYRHCHKKKVLDLKNSISFGYIEAVAYMIMEASQQSPEGFRLLLVS